MDFAKSHAKILVVLAALVAVGASAVVFDSPSFLSSTSPSPTPFQSPTPVGSTPEGRMKADTFVPTIPPTLPPEIAAGGCSTLAVDLVLDTSASMKRPTDNPRLETLKDAVSSFISEIPDEAVVAIQQFDKQARSVVSPVILKTGREEIRNDVEQLRAAGEGGTHVREGLYKAIKLIEEGNTMFPGRRWVLILLSDGAPNPQEQEGTDPASELKGMGVKIITIGLDMDEEENVTPEEAREHMRDVASSPSDFYDASSDDLADVYQQISENICE